nr:hypothetical protein [Tanacetum cinerariifolium]
MLFFSRAPLFVWAEAITASCYTQNRSIIHRRFNKTPYELINGKKLDISFRHVFGALCYPKNDSEVIGKLGAKDTAPTPTNSSPQATDIPSRIAMSTSTIDPTLFIRCFDDDILVVQVYVDDIIIGSTNLWYTQLFADLMKSRFEMLMMREMTFFPCGIFINQSNYMLEVLKNGMETCHPIGTPMEIKDKLDLDKNGTLVDATKYHSMIGALMYLTSSKLDIIHATCLCARYQAKPTKKHLKEVKGIFLYLWGTVNIGLWYTKDSGFELTSFLDAKYAGCKDTFKGTSGGA